MSDTKVKDIALSTLLELAQMSTYPEVRLKAAMALLGHAQESAYLAAYSHAKGAD